MSKDKNPRIFHFPISITEAERQVEAILFAAEEPLDVESIQSRIQVKTNVTKMLESLQKQYRNRGINLICISNKWSFRTASNLSKLMVKQISTQKKLSKAAVETLAIIVYHQPVTRSEIEEIRGVAFATGTLEILLELNWVRPSGRKNVPGKPIQYVTTDDFLSHFNLQKLSDLPNIEELTSAGLIGVYSIKARDPRWMLASYLLFIFYGLRFAASQVTLAWGGGDGDMFDLEQNTWMEMLLVVLYAVSLVMYLELTNSVIRFSMLDTSIKTNEVYVMNVKKMKNVKKVN